MEAFVVIWGYLVINTLWSEEKGREIPVKFSLYSPIYYNDGERRNNYDTEEVT